MTAAAQADAEPGKVIEMALRVGGTSRARWSLIICQGDWLGMYRALDEAGPVTAGELAAGTGLYERWLLEWLRG